MTSVACPHCGVANHPQQSHWNYCEKCGGRLPGAVIPTEPATARSAGAVSSSVAVLSRPRAATSLADYKSPRTAASLNAGPSTPARTRPDPRAYLVIAICVAVCMFAIVAINNGKTDYIWLGGGLGAGLGAFVSQLLGFWPTKGAKR